MVTFSGLPLALCIALAFSNIVGSGSTNSTREAVKENSQLSVASVRAPSTSTHFGCADSPFTMCNKSLIAPPNVLLELCNHTCY